MRVGASSRFSMRLRRGLHGDPNELRGARASTPSRARQTTSETSLSAEGPTPGSVFTVAFVCTGNRARSPLAEALFRRHVESLPVDVSSCGTLDLAGMPPLPEASAVAAVRGIDLRAHRSQPLRAGVLADADLVVGFEPSHIVRAVEVGEAERGRTFLLLELPILLAGSPAAPPQTLSAVDAARQVVRAMDERRAVQLMSEDRVTLRDPYGESRQGFAEMARVVDAMTGLLATRLFPDVASG